MAVAVDEKYGHFLGKKPATADKRDKTFASLKTEAISTLSLKTPFGHRAMSEKLQPWNMLGNGPDDSVSPRFGGAGDCVWAGAAHETMLWLAETGVKLDITGKEVIKDYGDNTGYDPVTGANDNGTVVRDALDFRVHTGVLAADGKRHKIGAYVALDLGNWNELMEALRIFSAVGIGFQCPDYLFDQFNSGQPWSVLPGQHGIIGGHYVPIVGQFTADMVTCISWAKPQRMTRGFFQANVDEAWGILSTEMLKGSGKSIDGFDLAALQQEIKEG